MTTLYEHLVRLSVIVCLVLHFKYDSKNYMSTHCVYQKDGYGESVVISENVSSMTATLGSLCKKCCKSIK